MTTIDPDVLERLMASMCRYGIQSIDVHAGGTRVALRRDTTTLSALSLPPAEPPRAPSPDAHVTAPVTGVFHAAPTPTASPFVAVGATVRPGDVLCLLEAGGVLSEIESELAGVVRAIHPTPGALVAVGATLFTLGPEAP